MQIHQLFRTKRFWNLDQMSNSFLVTKYRCPSKTGAKKITSLKKQVLYLKVLLLGNSWLSTLRSCLSTKKSVEDIGGFNQGLLEERNPQELAAPQEKV